MVGGDIVIRFSRSTRATILAPLHVVEVRMVFGVQD